MFEAVNTRLLAQGLMVRQASIIYATIIAVPSSSKYIDGTRESEIRQIRKGHQWSFGMTAHVAADARAGLIRTVGATAANVHDVT